MDTTKYALFAYNQLAMTVRKAEGSQSQHQAQDNSCKPSKFVDDSGSIGLCQAMRLHHIQYAVLSCPDLASSLAAYQSLGLQVHADGSMAQSDALRLGFAAWVGRRCIWLASEANRPWLCLVDAPELQASPAFAHRGWLALEVLVDDLVGLAAQLQQDQQSPFRVLQAPKALDFTDAIHAMQVQGPSGEVLYLTEVKQAVAPFRLPISTPSNTQQQASCRQIFVAVLAASNRAQSLAFYQGLGIANHANATLNFDTRLSAFNAAHQLSLETKHPLATAQLVGEALLEIDQVGAHLDQALGPQAKRSGIVAIAFARQGSRAQPGPERALSGPDGELVLLC